MNFSKLEQLIDSLPSSGIPFCDLAVTKDGQEVFRRSVGCSDAEGKKPASDTDLYWIFSTCKVITCTAAMRLVEEGKLRLDAPVSEYLPAFRNLTVRTATGEIVPCQTPMTIEHLFSMSGGMSYDIDAAPIAEAAAVPGAGTVDIVNSFAKIPLLFEPGTHYRYSLCHDILAAVVEVVSGMKFSEYVQKLIFDPLGMKDTGFRPNEEQKSRFVSFYSFDHATGTSVPMVYNNRYVFTPDYDSGGAGMFSRVSDYIKLVTTLACGGTTKDGYHLLAPETIAQMEVNHLCHAGLLDFVRGRLYGYGWGLCGRVHINPAYSRSRSAVGEFGWDGAAGAFAMVDRANRVALFFATEVMNCNYTYNIIHPLLRNLVYEGLEE